MKQQKPESAEMPKLPTLVVRVFPGRATPEEIEDILNDLSELYRSMGGSGIKWSLDTSIDLNESTWPDKQ